MLIKLFNGGGYTVLSPKPPVVAPKLTQYSILLLTGAITTGKICGYLVLVAKPPAKLFTLNKYTMVVPVPPVRTHKATKYAAIRALSIATISKKQSMYSVLVGNPLLTQKVNGYTALYLQGGTGGRVEKLTKYVTIQYVPAPGVYVTVNIS